MKQSRVKILTIMWLYMPMSRLRRHHNSQSGYVNHIRITCPCDLYPIAPTFYSKTLVYKGIHFSSPEPLGSQCELIVYQSSRRPSVWRRLSFSKIFFSETAWPLKPNFMCSLIVKVELKFVLTV